MNPDQLIAEYNQASELGAAAYLEAQRYADARGEALAGLVDAGESLAQIAERVGLTRERVRQLIAKARKDAS